MQTMTIEEALESHTPDLMAIPGVVGTAMGLHGEEPCIHVYVEDRKQHTTDMLPRDIEGYKVRVVVSGKIFALGE